MDFLTLLNTVHTHRQLRQEGLGSSVIARKTRQKELTRLIPGVYTSAQDFPELPFHQQYPYYLAAVFAKNPTAVFTHQSAAWLHGLAIDNPQKVDVYCPSNSRGRPYQVRKHYYLQEPELTTLHGFLQVTSLRQTLRDLCSYLHPADALITLESALYQQRCQVAELGEYFAQQQGHRSRKIKILASLMSPLSESPGESRLKWVLYQSSLPMPEQQVKVEVQGERFRLDFGYRKQKVALEFDGRTKYMGEDSRRVIYEELRREKLLKNDGWEILRYDWSTVVRRSQQIVTDLAGVLRRKGLDLSGQRRT